jgi:transposase
MLTMTNTTVTREHVWTAFHRTPDVRLRERDHSILLVMDGKSCPEIAQWLYRDEETIRSWVRTFNEAGLPGLERTASPGRPA